MLERPYLLLATVTLICLLPFAGKAFHVDEPLFIWTAQQIQAAPFDFYGFDVNWYGVLEPMHGVMKNPPLAAYYAAAVAALFGSREIALHLAFLLPALGVVLGTFRLARRFCSRPLLAALLVLVSPVFLVSAMAVSSDVAMLCLWIWATVLWVEGLESDSRAKLLGGALLIGAAALTKYFAVSLLPLLAAYTLMRERRDWRRLLWLLLPVALLAGYQFWTQQSYGRGLLLDAASYATMRRELSLAGLGRSAWIALCFTGGCLLPLLFCAPLLWSRRVVIAALGAGLVAAVASWCWIADLAPQAVGVPTWFLALQVSLLALGGVAAIALGLRELVSTRDPAGLLLAGWLLGTFFFAGFVNWAVNGRSILPMTVAAAILVVRRLDSFPEAVRPRRLAWMLLPAVLVAVLVAASDTATANAQRSAASRLTTAHRPAQSELWFQGHWGFQYYMERLGARPLNYDGTLLEAGDRMVLPRNNTNVQRAPLAHAVRTVELLSIPITPGFVSTFDPRRGAGFYYHGMGPLPFAFGPSSPVEFEVVELTRELNVSARPR